jgi:alpha-1,4-digalacturonate transport system permease protein
MKTWEQKLFPYLMLLPMLLIFTVFLFYPAVNGLWTSFHKWDGVNPAKFIGWENYVNLFQDTAFWKSVGRTLLFTLISVPGIYILGLALALLLTTSIKGRAVYRAVFYLPCLISSIVVGLAWRFLLSEDFGVVNYLLTVMGGKPVRWLTDPRNALVAVAMISIWSMAGYYMVMFISGLQTIDTEYYDAASIDGANGWQRFLHITLPLLRPTSLLVLVLSTVAIIKTYPLVVALTGGGPAGATKFIVHIIQETGFEKYKMGYASAMTMVLFFLLMILTLLQFKFSRGGKTNEN